MTWLLALTLFLVPAHAGKQSRVEGDAVVGDDVPPPSQDLTDVVEAAELGNRGDREGAIAILDRVLARRPEHAEARLLRGLQHYLLRDNDAAKADLTEALTGGRYEEKNSVQQLDEVTTTTYILDLGATRAAGAGMLVVLHTRAGDFVEASDVLTYALDRHGDVPHLLMADAYLLHAKGEHGAAWARAREAVEVSAGELFVQGLVGELAARDPDGVPEDVYAWLDTTGTWTTPYNKAIGELTGRRHAACTLTIAEALARIPGHHRLLELGYRCASRSDRGKADAWLEALGGPRRAAPGDVLAHAELAVTSGDPERAEVILDGLPRRLDPDSARRVATFRIDLLLSRGNLGKAARFADGTAPDADARVAHALIERGEVQSAERILSKACPLLIGEDAHGQCASLLQWARAQ